MLTQPIITIFDKKTGLYDRPISVNHVGEAIREFDNLIKQPGNKYSMNPEDFSVFQIATYEVETGTISMIKPYLHLADGIKNGDHTN